MLLCMGEEDGWRAPIIPGPIGGLQGTVFILNNKEPMKT